MKQIKYFLSLVFLFSAIGFAQQASEKVPLIEYMRMLEQQFDVKFSYSVNEVNSIEIKKPKESFSLQQAIDYLNARTILNFKFLNNRYITVSTLDKVISICGTLLADSNNEPLLGASIMVDKGAMGTVSGTDGTFELQEVALNGLVTISFLGYETKNIPAKDFFSEKCPTIFMIEKNELLNRVLITKFLTTGLQKRIDGSTVLNTQEFGILPGLIEPDVLQSIQALPGVESVNESIANINVRGGTNDQNLMLWDHIKMYHSGHFFGLISAYNPNLANKIIVTKNGTSSEFSDGVSSTVNMFTKNEIDNTFSGGGGFNLINADVFFEIPIAKNLELHISGRRSYTDFLTSPTYNNYFERSFQDSEITNNSDNISESNTSSDFFFYDYTTKLLFDFNDRHKLRANIIGIYNNLDYNESYTDNHGETESKTSNLKQENLGVGANWNAIWSDTFNTELIVFYSKYNVDATDYRIETDQRLTQANEVLETGLKFKTRFKVNDYFTMLNGYQLNELGILNETTVNAPSYERTKKDVVLNHALFSEITYHKLNTYFRIGVRANYFQKFAKVLLEPRLNIRQKLSSQFALKIQGEFKNQSATQIVDFQDDFLGVENRRWILANENNIPIAKSKQVSFGVEYMHNNLTIDIEGFYKMVEGITASNQGFYNNFQYINASGDYTARGVEFLANKTSDKYSTWVSYTYSVNDYEFKDFTPSEFPNNVDVRHSLSMAFNYHITKDLNISIGGIWRSGRPYTKPVEGNETTQKGNATLVNYDAPNSENLSDFMRLDASLSYGFDFSESVKATLRVGVINLTNYKNVINRYYEVDPNDSESTIQIDNESLKLTPNISFRVRF